MPSPGDLSNPGRDGCKSQASNTGLEAANGSHSPQGEVDTASLLRELAAARSEAALASRALELFVEFGSDACLLTDEHGRVTKANPRVREITCLDPQDLVHGFGRIYTATSPGRKPVDIEDLPLRHALHGRTVRDLQLLFHFPDGKRAVQASSAPVLDSDQRVRGTVTVFQDISRRLKDRQRAELLNILTKILSSGELESHRFDQIARLVGKVMGGWTVLGLIRDDGSALDIVASFHPDSGYHAELKKLFQGVSVDLEADPGLGKVARTGTPLLFETAPANGSFPTSLETLRTWSTRLGCDSLLIAPLMARGRTLGALMLVSLPDWPHLTQEDLDYTQQLVGRIASALDSVRLHREIRRKEWRMRMLAEISRTFASSLEVSQVSRTVAVQVAEALGDWCIIGLLDGRGHHIRVQECYHRNADQLPKLQRLARRCVLDVGQALPGRVVATQVPRLVDDSTPASEIDDEGVHARLMTAMAPSSYLCVPLSVGAIPLGYLELGCNPASGRTLGETEFALVRDLADRAASSIQNAKLFEALQRALRAKDEWLTVASHELKTPLTPLQVLLQLMGRRLKRGEQVDLAHVDRCLAQVNKLTRIINDLLDVSRLEVGQLELSLDRFEIQELAEQVAAQFRGSSDRHAIEVQSGETPLVVRADRERIEQVLENLVHNAIKFSPEGGLIRISVVREDRAGAAGVVVSVEDEGIGIPPEDRPRLFQRYFRASNVSGRNYGGLGLGLWLSNEIIVRHHGRLWAEARQERGSRFSFWLPLLEPGVDRSGDAPPLVLIVDDDDQVLRTAAAHLSRGGYEVVTARNAHAAMTVLSEREPRVMLLDIMMPGLDAWQLIRDMDRLPDHESIKVILTGATQNLYARAHELGAHGYLPKPFALDQLTAKVDEAAGA